MTPHYEAAINAGLPVDYDLDCIKDYMARPAAEICFVSSAWGWGGTHFPLEWLDDDFPPLERASFHYAEGCGDPIVDPRAYWAKRAGDFGGFAVLMTPKPRPYQRFVFGGLAGIGINILRFYPGADEVTPYLRGAAEAGLIETPYGRFDRPWNPSRAIGRELPDPWESAYDRRQRDRARRQSQGADNVPAPSMVEVLRIMAGAALEVCGLRK